MANPIKKCVLHGSVNNTTTDLYPRTNLASVSDMTAFARSLNTAADAAAARNTLGITTQAALINIIYPVGSVITLTNDTDPNKIYTGTTWVKMDAGRVLVSAGTYTEDGETYTYTLGDKGGEAKHTLTAAEMPAHSHTGTTSTNGNHTHQVSRNMDLSSTDPTYEGGSHDTICDYDGGTNFKTSTAGNHDHTFTTGNSGGGAAHNNMSPYLVCYIWQRTA